MSPRTGVRITAGRFGGLRLETLRGRAVRPTADRVKEALFSMLGPALAGARVVDCFAGTGALGIEAASRGAARVTFVERDPRSLDLLRRNLERLPEPVEARVVPEDALRPDRWGREGLPADIILVDPPYRQGLGEALLAALAGAAGSEGATVVLEHETGAAPGHPRWTVVRSRRYGDTTLTFYRSAGADAKGDSDANRDLSGDL